MLPVVLPSDDAADTAGGRLDTRRRRRVARCFGHAALDLRQLAGVLALLGGEGGGDRFVLEPLRFDLAQSHDLGLGGSLQLDQLALRTLQRAFVLVELFALLLEPQLGFVVVVDRGGPGLGDHLGEHVGLQLRRGLAQVGEDRDAGHAAGHEAVDGDGLDGALELGDLRLEILDLELEPLLVELEQRQPRLGGEERFGRVVGALTRGGDLGRGLLGDILVGLGDDRSGDDGDQPDRGECTEDVTHRPESYRPDRSVLLQLRYGYRRCSTPGGYTACSCPQPRPSSRSTRSCSYATAHGSSMR